MTRLLRPRLAPVLAVCALFPGAALAFGDENWPCPQRKVEHLSWGQMWTGPALPENARWRQDDTLAQLVPLLTARTSGSLAAHPIARTP